MAAGTVISGGFPGRVAQEVQPNQKCGGCLHYDGQAGRTGACTIGDSPWKCGDGDAPDIGYAPLARGAGSYLPDMSNHGAHASEVDPQNVGGLYGFGSTRPVPIHQVSLGEEHVHLVKSMVERHMQLQKSQCNLCSMGGTHGTAPPNVGYQLCTCRSLEAATVVKAIVNQMSNAQRARLLQDPDWVSVASDWVREVAKAGFRLPVPKKARSLGARVAGADRQGEDKPKAPISDQVQISDTKGGHLHPVKVKKSELDQDVSKSFYSEDWIAQFKGTPLFKEAHKLCEQELVMEEEELARREVRAKNEKARAKAVKQVQATEPDYDWQEQEARRTKIRIAKQRLALKLAGLHQEKMTVAKSDEGAARVTSYKAPHGNYKIEHHADHAVVHYKPKSDSPAPAQSAKMKSGERATKMAKIHAFVNNHGFPGHATLHEDHVKLHDKDTGATHKTTSLSHAREFLGY